MKVLLIEDDQQTSELLSATLSAHHYAVDAIADGSDGLELAIQWSYDLILLDVLLPTLNGVEVCRRLRTQGCQTPVLMLTTKDSNEDIIAGLDAGADDYVAKTCDPSQLLARVRALLRRGGNATSTPVLTWGLLCLDPALAQVTYNQQVIALRPKEYSLLELFLRHPQHILSRSAIIDHLWSMEETPIEGSITNLIKDLRQRLKSAGMVTDLIETVYGLGYRLKTAPKDTEIEKQKNVGIEREGGSNVSKFVSTIDRGDNRNIRAQRGMTAVQQITERFQVSLEQRIGVLEAVARSLQAGSFSLQQGEAARKEAHKLAGGLGTFGYGKASEIAQAIECVLDNLLANNLLEVSQKTQLANQLVQLLEDLKQSLTKCGSTL